MTTPDRPWPPLIVAAHQPAWRRWRDIALTAGMWLLLAAMLSHEFRFLIGNYLKPLGVDQLFHRLGVSDVSAKLNRLEFVSYLSPYVLVIGVLLTFLSGFSVHTLLRRHHAIRQPDPVPLSLDSQAREAALPPLTVSGAMNARAVGMRLGQDGAPPVNPRFLLALMNSQDQAMLETVRSLRISTLRVTADGQYRVESAEEVPTALGQAPS